MANIKVSEMTEATSFDDGDYTMIVQANQNKKISKENMLSDIPTIQNNISTINNNIGNLTNLETVDTTNIVNSINSLVPVVLYNSEEPNEGSVTLNDDYTNYTYLEVIGVGADGGMVSSRSKVSNLQGGATINLVGTSIRDNGQTIVFWVSTLKPTSATVLTPQSSQWAWFSAGNQGVSQNNYMGVLTVLGYK